MRKLLFICMLALAALAAGCGSSSANTTSTAEARITKYAIGEEFPVTDTKGNTAYMATVTGVTSPYDLPYKTTSERVMNHIMFDPKPGYKYVRVNVKIKNTGTYPGAFFAQDFALFNERDEGALQAGIESVNDATLFSVGGDLLPGEEKTGAIIYQMPDAAVPTTMQVWYLGEKDRSPKMPEINLT